MSNLPQTAKRNLEGKPNDLNFIEGDTFDLILFWKAIVSSKRLIFWCLIICIIIGSIFAFGSKTEYTSNCKLMPESNQGLKMNLGGLGGLAGLAGISLPENEGMALNPDIYPQIIQSVPFQLQLLKKTVHFSKLDTSISSKVFFQDFNKPSLLEWIYNYTLKLPWTLKNKLFRNAASGTMRGSEAGDIIQISKTDYDLIKIFRKRINVSVDDKSRIISISSTMPDRVASAQLADMAVKMLTKYLIDYKIRKAEDNYKFILERYEESRTKFELTQQRLAMFSDRNQNVSTASARIEQQKLQNEFDIAFEVYKNLATQREQSEIKVKEETPIFTILEPVRIPVERSSPKRTIILALALIMGFISAIVIIFLKGFLHSRSHLTAS